MKARIHLLGAVALAAMALMGVSTVLAEARVFVGNKKANKVTGTKKGDTIRLGAGNDRARGRGGGDRIFGAAGKDRLSGDSGRDRMSGGSGNDTLAGGASHDRLSAGSGNDRASGGSGNDRLAGNSGRDRLNGGKGADRLAGGSGNDYLDAADGRKDVSVDGGSGRNTCRIDAADLSVAKKCGAVTVAPAGSGAPGAPGSGTGGGPGGVGLPGAPGGPGGPGGPGAPGTVNLVQGSGLQCNALTPSCAFALTVDPGNTPIGELLSEMQIELNGDAALLSVNPLVQVGDNVVAGGAYVCTGAAVLVVVFQDQRIEIPVACERP